MRLQLAAGCAVLAGLAAPARADGTLSMRGVYYKERSTRVIQPMLDGLFEVGARGLLDAHFLVDAITSASAGSGAANAVPFSEQRYEAGGGYTREFDGPASLAWLDKFRLGAEGKFSTESDYHSGYIGVRGAADVAQKNATIEGGAGYSHDTMDASNAQGALGGIKLQCPGNSDPASKGCHLRTYTAFGSVSQIISRNALVALTYDMSYLDGFQSNPYRLALTTTGFVPEKHPFTRLRQAVALSTRIYIPASQTTLIAAYRYYHDDWKITAHTPEIRIVQQAGLDVDATFGYRYYTQTASYFYQVRYPDPSVMPLSYYTDDPKMSAFDGHMFEAKLGVLGDAFELKHRWAAARFEGILDYIVQHNRFGNAVEAHVALTVPFDY
ncbi:MAG TPA: DUF3570 domain-containing protein [Kofleriaceae bacterium]|nr:DUF3570 domain-containing protein [Kofleriaceae bacterium]